MNDIANNGNVLSVPKGTPGIEPLHLDMTVLYEADRRMHEIRLVSKATCQELGGLFNQACNLAGKYLAYVKYELLKAEKNHNLNRATVILEKAPLEAMKLKAVGIKLTKTFAKR